MTPIIFSHRLVFSWSCESDLLLRVVHIDKRYPEENCGEASRELHKVYNYDLLLLLPISRNHHYCAGLFMTTNVLF